MISLCTDRKRGKKGFTLLELVLVLGIIAIGGFIIGPQMVNFFNHWNMRTEVRKVVLKIVEAQQMAKSQQTNHGLRFDSATETYFDGYWDGGAFVDQTAFVLKHNIEIDFTVGFVPADVLYFDGLGVPASGSMMRISFRDPGGATLDIIVRQVTGEAFINE